MKPGRAFCCAVCWCAAETLGACNAGDNGDVSSAIVPEKIERRGYALHKATRIGIDGIKLGLDVERDVVVSDARHVEIYVGLLVAAKH